MPEATEGYKVADPAWDIILTSDTSFDVDTTITALAVVDEMQSNYTYKVNYLEKDTEVVLKDQVTGTGYIGEVITPDTELAGYKLVEGQEPLEVEILADNTATLNIYYVKDETNWVTITFVAGEHIEPLTGETSFEVIKGLALNEANQPEVTVPMPEATEGYKVADPAWDIILTSDTSFDVDTTITALAVVDEMQSNYTYKVNYLEKDTENVLKDATTDQGYIGEEVTITAPEIAGYKLVDGQELKVTVLADNTATLNVYFEKDLENQWLTITFDKGEHGTISGETSYQVIKGLALNDDSQPEIIVPEITANHGYKTSDPLFVADGVSFDLALELTEDTTFIAQYLPDEEVDDFEYTVNYLEEGTEKVLSEPTTGKGYVGETALVQAQQIKGYKLVEGQEPLEVEILADNSATLNIYYELNENDWVQITFVAGENIESIEGTLTYKVIKDLPLGGDNQPEVLLPTAEAKDGYKVASPAWDMLVNESTVFTDENTTITALAVVDERQTNYQYEINFLLEDNSVLKGQVIGTGYIGQVITPDTLVPGYKLVEGQETTLEVLEDNTAKLDLYYEINEDDWVKVVFTSDENTELIGETEYSVISGIALNEANQPSVDIPTPVAKPGYKLADPIWDKTITKDAILTDDVTTVTAKSVPDETQQFRYEANFLEQGTNKVLKEQVVEFGHVEEIIEITDLEVKGYELVENQETTLEVLVNNQAKLDIYYVASETAWVTITFNAGENAQLTGTLEYQVIKDLALNGANQPEVIVPEIEANEGYKVADPAWDILVNDDSVFTENTTITAQVEVDETYKEFGYEVNFLEQDTEKVLKDQITGSGHIGEEITITDTNISGYKLVEEKDYTVTVSEEGTEVLNIYYLKDDSQWVQIEFVKGENVERLEGTLTYEVIKDKPLTEPNQPEVIIPTIIALPGYKPAEEPWDIIITSDTVFTLETTEITSTVEVDETQKDYKYLVYFEDEEANMLKDTIEGYGHIGEVIELTEEQLTIPGYKLVDGQETTLEVLEDNTAKLTVVYKVDETRWVTLRFVKGNNIESIDGTLEYKVIKGVPLGNENQPEVVIPTPHAKEGYKLDDPAWSREVTLESLFTVRETIVISRAVVDETKVDYQYKVEYLDKQTNKKLSEDTIGHGYIGQEISVTPKEIKGYKLVEDQNLTVKVLSDNTANLDLYYVKAEEEWTTLTFNKGDHGTISGISSYEVIKGLALNEANQPEIILPEIIPNQGYRLDDPLFVADGVAFDLSLELLEATTFTARYIPDAEEEFEYTVNYLEEGTEKVLSDPTSGRGMVDEVVTIEAQEIKGYQLVEGTLTYEVIKGLELGGDNQPEVILPSATPEEGYKLSSPVWDIEVNDSSVFEVDTQITAKAVVDERQSNYHYEINFLLEEDSSVLKDQVTGSSYIGDTIEPDTTVPGYKVADGQETTLEVLKDNTAKLDIYYVKDETQWVKITFTHDENTTLRGKTEYKVIKGLALNEHNQPDVVVPTPIANPGYKLNDPVWSRTITYTEPVTRNVTIKASSSPDEAQRNYRYEVNFLEEGTNKVLKDQIVDEGYATEEISLTLEELEVKGYKLVSGQETTLEVMEDNSAILNVYYVKDETNWVTISFEDSEKATLDSYPTYEVIKGLALNEANQPEITLPIAEALEGYKLVGNDFENDLGELFSLSLVLEEDTIFKPKYEVNEQYKEFIYKVNYVLDETDEEIKPQLESRGYVGEEVSLAYEDVNVPGYELIEGQVTTLTIQEDNSSELTLRYQKDTTQWIKVRFIGSENVDMTGASEFEVIKDIPLNDPLQPQVTPPEVTAKPGHVLVHPKWNPEFNIKSTLTADQDFTVITALDPKVTEYNYVLYHKELGTEEEIAAPTTGTGKLDDLVEIPAITVEGYQEAPGQDTKIKILNDGTAELTKYYVRNDYPLTVRYIYENADGEEVEIKTTDVITGYLGEEIYLLTALDIVIDGYDIDFDKTKELNNLDSYTVVITEKENQEMKIYYNVRASRIVGVYFDAGEHATFAETNSRYVRTKVYNDMPLNDPLQDQFYVPNLDDVVLQEGYKISSEPWSPVLDLGVTITEEVIYYLQVEIDTEQSNYQMLINRVYETSQEGVYENIASQVTITGYLTEEFDLNINEVLDEELYNELHVPGYKVSARKTQDRNGISSLVVALDEDPEQTIDLVFVKDENEWVNITYKFKNPAHGQFIIDGELVDVYETEVVKGIPVNSPDQPNPLNENPEYELTTGYKVSVDGFKEEEFDTPFDYNSVLTRDNLVWVHTELDTEQLVTITFVSESDQVEITGETTFEVIKGVRLDDPNQLPLEVPELSVNYGYKLTDPIWTLDVTGETIFNEDTIIKTNAIVDETITDFTYTVNYLEKDQDPAVELKDQVIGSGYIGQEVNITAPEILGYILVEDQDLTVTILEDNTAELNIYYEKDLLNQWIDLTFAHDVNTVLEGELEYKVIKGLALNGANQPEVVVPQASPKDGYMLKDPVWDKEVNIDSVFEDDTIVFATSIPDPTQTNYKYVVHFFEVGTTFKLKDDLVGYGYISEVVDLVEEDVLDVSGYKLVENQKTTITIKKDNTAELIVYYTADETKWVTLSFVGDDNTTIRGISEFEVIANVPLNARNQPEIIVPTPIANDGYKLTSQIWDKELSYSKSISADTTVTALSEIDTHQNNFTYKVNFIEEETNKVLKDQIIGTGYVTQTIEVSEITDINIKGYKLVEGQVTSLEVLASNQAELNIYYVKDSAQWTTITFVGSENSELVGETLTYEVIKGLPLNDPKQPEIKVPEVKANDGYKLDTPKWDPAFDINGTVDVETTYQAQVVVDENYQEFGYKFVFKEKATDITLKEHKLGKGYINQEIVLTEEEIKVPGYKLVEDATTRLTVLEQDLTEHIVYYEKDETQWITVTFEADENTTLEGILEYQFIKDHPISGVNQPTDFRRPTPMAKRGYKLATPTWSMEITPHTVFTEPTVIKASSVVNEDAKLFDYVVNYLEKDTDKKLEEPYHGKGYIGEKVVAITPQIDGYKLYEGQDNSLIVLENNEAVLNVYYVKDSAQWTTITFIASCSCLLEEEFYEYEVIKGIPLNDSKQPEIFVPEVHAKPGYKLPSTVWNPAFDLNDIILEETTYIAKAEIDETQKDFTYTVKYLEQDTNEVLAESTTGQGYIGEVVTVTPLEIDGYKVVDGQELEVEVLEDNSAELDIYYVKDIENQWVTITFVKGAHIESLEGVTSYDVIKGLPLNGDNQPEVIPPTPKAESGYKLDDPAWDVLVSEESVFTANIEIESQAVVDEAQANYTYTVNHLEQDTNKVLAEPTTGQGYIGEVVTVTPLEIDGYKVVDSQQLEVEVLEDNTAKLDIYYEKDDLEWVTITFVASENSELAEGTYEYEVIKGIALDEANQPEITLPTVVPNKGYVEKDPLFVANINGSDVAYSETLQLEENTTFEAQVEINTLESEFDYIFKFVRASDSRKLKDPVEGKGYIGEEVELSLDQIDVPGYKLVDGQVTKLEVLEQDLTELVLEYEKDESEWITLTFTNDEYTTLSGDGALTYKVIKDVPLNGQNQPRVIIPTATADKGYKLSDPIWTIEISLEDALLADTTTRATSVKDKLAWVTLTFAASENASLSEGTHEYEVIKDLALNGKHQPAIIQPTVIPNDGYKVASPKWDPAFSLEDVLTENKTYEAQVVVDETQANYTYTVNYLEQGTNEVLAAPTTGQGYIGEVVTATPLEIDGYKVVSEQQLEVTVLEDNTAKLDIYYEKDELEWVTITFVKGDHVESLEGVTSYEVIKGLALNGENQPEVIPPTPQVESGYVVADPAWDIILTDESVFDSDTQITALAEPDKNDNTYKYTVNYIETENNTPLADPFVGTGYIGEVITAIDILEIPGYKLVADQELEVTVLKDNSATLNVLYEKDETEWVTLTFTGHEGVTLIGETLFEVIKGVALDSPSQAEHAVPEAQAKSGYRLLDPLFVAIINEEEVPYSGNLTLTESTEFVVQVEIDDTIREYDYEINFIEQETNKVLKEQIIDKGYIGEVITAIDILEIPGYKLVADQELEVTVLKDNSATLNVLYEKDETEWVTLTFTGHEGVTLIGETLFEVIKGIPLTDPLQPSQINPPKLIAEEGYIVVHPDWEPEFRSTGTYNADQEFNVIVTQDPAVAEYHYTVEHRDVSKSLDDEPLKTTEGVAPLSEFTNIGYETIENYIPARDYSDDVVVNPDFTAVIRKYYHKNDYQMTIEFYLSSNGIPTETTIQDPVTISGYVGEEIYLLTREDVSIVVEGHDINFDLTMSENGLDSYTVIMDENPEQTLKIYYTVSEERLVGIYFDAGENAKFSETNSRYFETTAYKDLPLNDAGQDRFEEPDVTTIILDEGYKLSDPAWSPVIDYETPVTESVVYQLQTEVDLSKSDYQLTVNRVIDVDGELQPLADSVLFEGYLGEEFNLHQRPVNDEEIYNKLKVSGYKVDVVRTKEVNNTTSLVAKLKTSPSEFDLVFTKDEDQWAKVTYKLSDSTKAKLVHNGEEVEQFEVELLKGLEINSQDQPNPLTENPEVRLNPGYKLADENPFRVKGFDAPMDYNEIITSDKVVTAYIEKDETEWITVTFVAEDEVILTGQTSFELIKGLALDDLNQETEIIVPQAEAKTGYKLASPVWSYEVIGESIFNENTEIIASAVVDESQADYDYLIKFLDKDSNENLKVPIEGKGYIGEVITPDTEIAGYKLVENQETSLTVREDNLATLNIYYEKDDSKWVTIKFDGDLNKVTIVGQTEYKVIEGIALNEANQPEIIVPELVAMHGYKVSTPAWSEELDLTQSITEDKVIEALVEVDTKLKDFDYVVTYIEQETGKELETRTNGKGAIGEVVTIDAPEIYGYKVVDGQVLELEVLEDNSASLVVYYEKVTDMWVTLTFDPTEKGKLIIAGSDEPTSDPYVVDLLVDVDFTDPRQPQFEVPQIEPNEYYLVARPKWDPQIGLFDVPTEDMLVTAQYDKNPDMWVTVTYLIDDETVYNTSEIKKGSHPDSILIPTEDLPEGVKSFVGWKETKDSEDLVDFNELVANEDINLYAAFKYENIQGRLYYVEISCFDELNSLLEVDQNEFLDKFNECKADTDTYTYLLGDTKEANVYHEVPTEFIEEEGYKILEGYEQVFTTLNDPSKEFVRGGETYNSTNWFVIPVEKDETKWTTFTYQADGNAKLIDPETEAEVGEVVYDVLLGKAITDPYNQGLLTVPETIYRAGYKAASPEWVYTDSSFDETAPLEGPVVMKHQSVKDETKWVTLTFVTGENGKFADETYEYQVQVLKDVRLDDSDQPALNIPEVVPNENYILADPAWDQSIDGDKQFSENTTITAIYEISSEHAATIRFVVGENGSFEGMTEKVVSYEVIKNVPLNDPSQPEILVPTVNVEYGYKVDLENPWTPAYNNEAVITENIEYVANIVKNDEQWITVTFTAPVGVIFTENNTNELSYSMLKDVALNDSTQETPILEAPQTEIENPRIGYADNMWPDFNKTDKHLEDHVYELATIELVQVTFKVGGPIESESDYVDYEVIYVEKSKPFADQVPTVLEADWPADVIEFEGWKKTFDSETIVNFETATVTADQVYYSVFVSSKVDVTLVLVGVDSDEMFEEAETLFNTNIEEFYNRVETIVLKTKDVLGEDKEAYAEYNISEIATLDGFSLNAGYETYTPVVEAEEKVATINGVETNYTNYVLVRLDKDETQWTEVVFTIQPGVKFVDSELEEIRYSVVKDVPLGDERQPEPVLEAPAIEALYGYELDAENWLPAFDPEEAISDTKEYQAQASKIETMWVQITFLPGDNATLTGETSFEVLKDVPFNDERQPEIQVPTINPDEKWMVDLEQAWLPEYSETNSVSTDTEYTANVVHNPEDWVTVTFMNEDTVFATQEVEKGGYATNPGDVLEADWPEHVESFDGWYDESDAKVSFDAYVFTEDTTLNAKYNYPVTQVRLVTVTNISLEETQALQEQYRQNPNDLPSLIAASEANQVGTTYVAIDFILVPANFNSVLTEIEDTHSVEVNSAYQQIRQADYLLQPLQDEYQVGDKNTTNYYVVLVEKDLTQWETITFEVGEHGQFKDAELVNENSVEYEAMKGLSYNDSNNFPAISAPSIEADEAFIFVGWEPEFNGTDVVDGPKTFIAQYEYNPDYTVTITFSPGPNATLEGTTQYEVLNNVPLNDPLQPEIVVPTVNPNEKYLNDPEGDWDPVFDITATISEDTEYVARVINDPEYFAEVTFMNYGEHYDTKYVEKGHNLTDIPANVPEDQWPQYGERFIGWTTEEENLETQINFAETTIEDDLTVYAYVENQKTEWLVAFVLVDDQATADNLQTNLRQNGYGTDFKSAVQEFGYIVDYVQATSVEINKHFNLDNEFIEVENAKKVKVDTAYNYMRTGDGLFINPPLEENQVGTANTTNYYVVRVYKDGEEWTTVTFDAGENGHFVDETLSSEQTVTYDVLIGVPYNSEENYPAVILPEVEGNAGYIYDSWDPQYSSELVPDGTQTFTAQYERDPLYAKVTFIAKGEVKHEVMVLKDTTFADEYPEITEQDWPSGATGYNGWAKQYPGGSTYPPSPNEYSVVDPDTYTVQKDEKLYAYFDGDDLDLFIIIAYFADDVEREQIREKFYGTPEGKLAFAIEDLNRAQYIDNNNSIRGAREGEIYTLDQLNINRRLESRGLMASEEDQNLTVRPLDPAYEYDSMVGLPEGFITGSQKNTTNWYLILVERDPDYWTTITFSAGEHASFEGTDETEISYPVSKLVRLSNSIQYFEVPTIIPDDGYRLPWTGNAWTPSFSDRVTITTPQTYTANVVRRGYYMYQTDDSLNSLGEPESSLSETLQIDALVPLQSESEAFDFTRKSYLSKR